MKFKILLTAILFVSIIMPNTVFGHYPHTSDECSTTEKLGTREQCIIEQRESGKEVKFVDIFFSEGAQNVGGNAANSAANEIPSKMEVAPGDGNTILVAVMANSGAFVLTGMKAWLGLPLGFHAAGRGAGEPAFDSYDLGIATGGVFDFEFPVVVTENTRVGMYNATLHVEYFRATDIGLNYRDFPVEFYLTGKSVLDARPVTPVLLPSTDNNAKIALVNDGSAPASGVIVSVGFPRTAIGSQTAQEATGILNVGTKVFNVGTIKPYSKVVIDPTLYVSPAIADTRQTVTVEIAYFDAYGQSRTALIPVNFLVAGTSTESIDFALTTDTPVIHTITETPFTVTLQNTGKETASSVEITINTPSTATVALNQQVPEASKSPIMIRGGDGYARIDGIKPGEKVEAKIILFASEEAVNTAYQLPVSISYLDQSGGVRQIQRFVSVYVQGTISLRVYDFGITYIGNEPNLSGYLLNEGTNMALFTTVELVDGQGVMKSTGGPQYLGDLTANSPLPFNIPVSVASETTADSYPVKVKVTYKDDLRIPFDVTIDGTVPYVPPAVKKSEAPSAFSNMGIYIGVGAAGVAGFFFVRRKRRTSAAAKGKVDNNDNDIDFLSETKK